MMASGSILTVLEDCSKEDRANKAIYEKSSISELVEIHEESHQSNNNKNNLKATRRKAIISSKTDNNSTTTRNETILSYSSKVWQYAIRCPDSNYSICCLCSDNKKISTNNGSTSTLRKHLISKHNIHELTLPIEKRKSAKMFININRKRELHALSINCIIKDGRTFNDLNKPGIRKLLQELLPGYEPPSRYMVTRFLKRLYAFHHKKLIDDLTAIDHISITFDFWSNRQAKSFLVITGHYFGIDSFSLQSKVLNFSTFDKQHKANEISQIVQAKLKELNVLHKVFRVTTDGAKNMVRAIDNIGFGSKRVWCIAHRLHLTITNAFGFWIVEEGEIEENVTSEAPLMNNTLNDQEEMVDIEEFQRNDELYELNKEFTNDIDLCDHELAEEEHGSDEESISDIVDEQIMDNWTIDVNEADSDAASDQDMIVSVVKKCRGLVLMIKRSTSITLFFDVERKKLNIKRNLCCDVKSRWNSTYCMIDAFLILREVIEKLFNNKHTLHLRPLHIKKLTNFELTSDDWVMLSSLHIVLQPFFHATKVISGRDYPSIGLAFYLLVRLKLFLQQQERKDNLMVKHLKQVLLSKFVYYFESDNEQINLLKLHSYFDPAGFATLTDYEKISIEQNIKQTVIDETSYSIESATSKLPICSNKNYSVKKINPHGHVHKSAIDVFNECVGESYYEEIGCDENKKATMSDDIHNYRKSVVQFNLTHKPDATSSTLFWQTYGQNFSILSKLAKKMLSTPATSVPSESCFSMSSYLGRKERARLTADNLCSSVFLKDKINF